MSAAASIEAARRPRTVAAQADRPLGIGARKRFDAKRTARTAQCPALTGFMLGVIVVSWLKCALERCLELHALRVLRRQDATGAGRSGPILWSALRRLRYAAALDIGCDEGVSHRTVCRRWWPPMHLFMDELIIHIRTVERQG
jgi:hypothetical protein